jgi:hypothetical protein
LQLGAVARNHGAGIPPPQFDIVTGHLSLVSRPRSLAAARGDLNSQPEAIRAIGEIVHMNDDLVVVEPHDRMSRRFHRARHMVRRDKDGALAAQADVVISGLSDLFGLIRGG